MIRISVLVSAITITVVTLSSRFCPLGVGPALHSGLCNLMHGVTVPLKYGLSTPLGTEMEGLMGQTWQVLRFWAQGHNATWFAGLIKCVFSYFQDFTEFIQIHNFCGHHDLHDKIILLTRTYLKVKYCCNTMSENFNFGHRLFEWVNSNMSSDSTTMDQVSLLFFFKHLPLSKSH